MSSQSSDNNAPSHSHIKVRIPEELEYFLLEEAKRLGITPDELVQQAVGSYCLSQMKAQRGWRD
jgi:hypothetical protein